MEQINGQQNERIAKLEVEIINLKEIFNKFITNDFHYLKEKAKELDKKLRLS